LNDLSASQATRKYLNYDSITAKRAQGATLWAKKDDYCVIIVVFVTICGMIRQKGSCVMQLRKLARCRRSIGVFQAPSNERKGIVLDKIKHKANFESQKWYMDEP
jgi:hypothetical protein